MQQYDASSQSTKARHRDSVTARSVKHACRRKREIILTTIRKTKKYTNLLSMRQDETSSGAGYMQVDRIASPDPNALPSTGISPAHRLSDIMELCASFDNRIKQHTGLQMLKSLLTDMAEYYDNSANSPVFSLVDYAEDEAIIVIINLLLSILSTESSLFMYSPIDLNEIEAPIRIMAAKLATDVVSIYVKYSDEIKAKSQMPTGSIRGAITELCASCTRWTKDIYSRIQRISLSMLKSQSGLILSTLKEVSSIPSSLINPFKEASTDARILMTTGLGIDLILCIVQSGEMLCRFMENEPADLTHGAMAPLWSALCTLLDYFRESQFEKSDYVLACRDRIGSLFIASPKLINNIIEMLFLDPVKETPTRRIIRGIALGFCQRIVMGKPAIIDMLICKTPVVSCITNIVCNNIDILKQLTPTHVIQVLSTPMDDIEAQYDACMRETFKAIHFIENVAAGTSYQLDMLAKSGVVPIIIEFAKFVQDTPAAITKGFHHTMLTHVISMIANIYLYDGAPLWKKILVEDCRIIPLLVKTVRRWRFEISLVLSALETLAHCLHEEIVYYNGSGKFKVICRGSSDDTDFIIDLPGTFPRAITYAEEFEMAGGHEMLELLESSKHDQILDLVQDITDLAGTYEFLCTRDSVSGPDTMWESESLSRLNQTTTEDYMTDFI